ncbi:uncharacterized protein [Apostichopus japonicus]
MMKLINILIFPVVLFTSQSELAPTNECELLQYISIGSNGTIQCLFEEYYAVSWYHPEEDKLILFSKNGDKGGDGYTSGNYDIFPNGSLFIRDVNLEHETLLRVTKVITLTEETVSYEIQVKTVVRPNTTYPIIGVCPDSHKACLKSLDSDTTLDCSIEKTRPPVNLTWMSRSLERNQTLASRYNVITQDNVTYTSSAAVIFLLTQWHLLTLFVCQASGLPPDLMQEKESFVLIDKIVNYTAVSIPTKKHFAKHSLMKLACTDTNGGMFVWRQRPSGQRYWSNILFFIPPPNSVTESYSSEFELDEDGRLFITKSESWHEGMYVCIHNKDSDEAVVLYDVQIYVNPVPAYPVVDGCSHQQYCVLHVKQGDVLTCSVHGIRPEVKLEWKTFPADGGISFSDQTHTVKQREDTYDVVITSTISSASSNRVTAVCRITESNNHQFDLTTTIDLFYETVRTTIDPTTSNVLIPTVIVSTLVIIALFLATLFLMIRKVKRRRRRSRDTNNVQENATEEATPMMKVVNDNSQQRYDENKEELFIDQLKRKYEILYDAVQPIPYIKDRMYCVDKVFVEGGMEYLDKTTVAKHGKEWKQMKSYDELMDGTRISSTRKILEGEPGYGKSTLTLQLVYDWCKGVPHSPLKQIKILILLRLRQLGGVNSIFEAVRRFILPGDSNFTDDEVKSIIKKCSSVMLVMDGYDEYPDQDKTKSDVYKIIKNDIFREIKVILTTRSSYLPNYRSPQTDRARLTGFDDLARDKYIRKAVTGDDDDEAVDEIKRKLQENPVLGYLCEVPLFFVMFAHITHENKELQTFHSVTGFFRYMISCFHNHMLNKMKDENVTTFKLFESNHSKLDEIAFKALSRKNQRIVWKKQNICKALGEAFYNQYVRIGILVEEEVLDMFSMPDAMGNMRSTVEVRFYHKLFCEWYAAHHLAMKVTKRLSISSAMLANLDPFDLQYVYRFACGLNKAAAQIIIKHLQKTNEGQKFAMLCILEQEGDNDELLESVTELVSNGVTVNVNDSKLLQRSVTQILEFASKKEIPITSVCLNKSFKECEEDVIVLHSGLRLNQLLTAEKIHIETEQVNEEPRILTEKDVTSMLRYGLRSEHLKELSFAGCTLPLSFSSESLPIDMRSRNIKVCWSLFDREFLLNVQSGNFEVEDMESLRQLCSEKVIMKNRGQYLKQWLTIISVQIASNHDIPISCVELFRCSPRVDESGLNLILQSGLSLSILSSLQKLWIYDDYRRLTNEELAAILSYSSQCTSLKQLKVSWYNLPDTIPVGFIPSSLKSRDVKVWNEGIYLSSSRRLNLQTGRWQRCDDDGNLPGEEECEKDVIVLHSGLRLHRWLTAKKIHIETEQVNGEPRIITEGDVRKMLRSKHLQELSFAGCTLPLSFSSELLPIDMRSRDIKVCWSLLDSEVLLNVQSGQWELKDKESLHQLCSEMVVIEDRDHYLQQCLTIISVQTASYHKIPISCVELFRCSPRVDESGLNLILQSGLSLSILSSLQKLWIRDNYRTLTNEELAAILSYSSQCTSLKQLKVSWYNLPDTIPVGFIPSSLKSRDVKVWNEGIYLSSSRRLNLQTGRWQQCDDDGNLPEEEDCEENVNVRHSGLRLHQWLTAEKKHIETDQVNEEPRILTEEDVTMMLSYGLHSVHLKELSFAGCTLPLSFSSESLPIDMRSRDIKVCWSLFDSEVLLNVQSGQWELKDKESLHQLCSEEVVITDRDHYLQQCLNIISVQTASYHNIPISCVCLFKCSPRVDESGLNLILQSGLSLSILSSLQKLWIRDNYRTLTNEEFAAILSYSSQCTSLKELGFGLYVLPDTIPVESIPSSLKSRNVKVWKWFSSSLRLNLQTGRWQACDYYGNLPGEEECEKDVIVLHSGLRLHRWLTAEKIHIETEQVNGEPRIITEEDVMEMLSYRLRSEHLKELSFAGCTLPLSFSLESLPRDMRSRDIKVCWSLLDSEVLLNVQSGQWEVKDKESLRQLCSGKVVIKDMDHYLQQCLTIISVQTASYHKIPITSVCLNKSLKECEKDVIVLHSGLRLNQLLTVEKIHIETEQVNGEPRILTEEDVTMVIRYGLRSEHLKDMSFAGCTLPLSFSLESLPLDMRSRDIKVCWSLFGSEVLLNVQSGQWELKDKESLRQLCSGKVVIEENDHYFKQCLTIISVQTASYHDIPISCVELFRCSPRVDESGLNLILQSGLSLSILSSLQKLWIYDDYRTLTNEELAAILSYSSQCTSLKELKFQEYSLSGTIPVGSIPSSLKSRNVKVWNEGSYSDSFSRLNLQTSRWQACDYYGNLPGEEECEKDVIVLHSGLRLHRWLTAEKIHIETQQVNGEPRILTEEDVTKMLSYGLRSEHLKELSFAGCTLPLSFSSESLPIDMRSRDIKVCWSLLDSEVLLNVQSGQWELEDKESLHQLCSVMVVIEDRDYCLQQCLTIISVQTASYHNIPISCVVLDNCSPRVDESGLNLILQSGLSLSILSSLQKLDIYDDYRKLTNEELAAILSYCSKCKSLKELKFSWYVLPDTIPVGIIPSSLETRNVKVWYEGIYSSSSRRLNLQTGRWQQCDDDGNLPEEEECEKDVIVLHSGLRLHRWLTAEKIHIETEQVNGEPRILTEEDVMEMLSYGLRSEHLKELSFAGCLLPLSFSSELLPIDMRSRDIKVCWSLLDSEVLLNVQSGQWELKDKESLRQLCSGKVVIEENDHYFKQCLTIISVQTASYHDIPISCVHLLDCSPRVDETGLNLILQSGLSLSILSSLQKLEIYDYDRRLTNEELAAILSYSSQCTILKELSCETISPCCTLTASMISAWVWTVLASFSTTTESWFGVYVLPDTIPVGIIPSSLETRNVKVWNEGFYSSTSCRLNLQTGRRQACDDDGNLPEEEECEEDVIVLHSGLRLHRWLTAEKIHIETERQVNGEPRILTEEDVMEMISYGLRSEHLKLSFAGCTLPLSFSLELLPREMRSWDIKVCWSLLDSEVLLNVQSGQWELKDKESLCQLCSEKVVIEDRYHYFKQCLTIISIQTASYHNIPISCVYLDRCSPRVDESGLNLILQSGLSLSILSSLQKLEIYDYYRKLTNKNLAAILSYSSQCTSLKELRFWFHDLPDTIPVGSIPSSLKSRNVKVWNEGIYSSSSRRLNLQTGRWQACDYYGYLPGEEECEEDVIVLHSGLRLNQLLTAEKIHIETEQVNGEPRIITEEDVTKMLSYGLRSEHFNELSFAGCRLPFSFSSESLPRDMRSRDIKVCWSLLDSEVLLNVQSGQWEVKDKESLCQLCSGKVVIEDRDHYLQQCLTIISIQTASYHNIPISGVYLCLCSPRVDESGLNLILQSGLSLSILSSLQKLEIYDDCRKLTNKKLAAILSYSSQCTSLKELRFSWYDLPDTIPVESIPSSLKSRNVKVWKWFSSSHHLNLQTGRWQTCDYYGNLPGEEECEKDVIVLHSGLRLHRWLTAEKIHIETDQVNGEPRILTEEDVMEMLSYGLRSEHLKELSFAGCLLPLSFSSELLPIDMRSRDIKVCWSLLDSEVLLNVQSGQWELKDKESLRQLCSGKVVIEENDHYFKQCLTIISVQTASYHDIPISCVYLGSCSPRVDESGLNLILKSGLSLPILSSLQKLVIFDDHRTLTNEDLAAILSYSSQCTSLKELKVSWYNLPDTIPVGFIPSSLKSRDVKVWNFRIPDRRLNLQTGLWQACDYYGILPGEEGFDEISY